MRTNESRGSSHVTTVRPLIGREQPGASFRQLVEGTVAQLEGAFACVFKSSLFPGECVATRRGSPMVVGIKSGLLQGNSPIWGCSYITYQ